LAFVEGFQFTLKLLSEVTACFLEVRKYFRWNASIAFRPIAERLWPWSFRHFEPEIMAIALLMNNIVTNYTYGKQSTESNSKQHSLEV